MPQDPRWLNNVILFSTEIWAEQLKKNHPLSGCHPQGASGLGNLTTTLLPPIMIVVALEGQSAQSGANFVENVIEDVQS